MDSIPAHMSESMKPNPNNASLQRNDSHDDNGVHHHYDNTSAASSKTSQKFRSPLYLKADERRYLKPTYIQDHDFPRLAASQSSAQQKKYLKRYHRGQTLKQHTSSSYNP